MGESSTTHILLIYMHLCSKVALFIVLLACMVPQIGTAAAVRGGVRHASRSDFSRSCGGDCDCFLAARSAASVEMLKHPQKDPHTAVGLIT